MNKDIIYTTREIDLKTCNFTKPQVIGDFRKSNVFINGHQGFILQTPKLTLRSVTESSVDLLVTRHKDRNREFYNLMSMLEDIAIQNITQNSNEWFGKKIPKDQVEMMIRSSLHCPLEIEDPFVFRVDKVNNLNIEPGMQVVCLIKVEGIIYGRTSSKIDMKVIHAKMIQTEKLPPNYETNSIVTERSTVPYFNDGNSVAPMLENSDKKSIRTVVSVPKSVRESVQEPVPVVPEIIEETIEELDQPPSDIESFKYEYMKASVENNTDFIEKYSKFYDV